MLNDIFDISKRRVVLGLVMLGSLACKPNAEKSEVNRLDLINHNVKFHEVEWISLGDKNYLKTSTAPITELQSYEKRKNKKTMCDIPKYSYIRAVVGGTESEKAENHLAICKIFEVRADKAHLNPLGEEDDSSLTRRMTKEELGCHKINEFFWGMNRSLLSGAFEKGETEEIHSAKNGILRFPWLYTYEENYGRVIRLKAQRKTYIKRSVQQQSELESDCKINGIPQENCYCEINPGDEIGVYLGSNPIRIKGHVKIQYIVDYTPEGASTPILKGDRCKDYKFMRKEIHKLKCGIALHGSTPNEEIAEKLNVDEDDYDEETVWSYGDSHSGSQDEQNSTLESLEKSSNKNKKHIFGFIFSKDFKWKDRNFNEEKELVVATKKEAITYSDDKWYWPTGKTDANPSYPYKKVTSQYGWRWGRMHKGVDIAGLNAKTPILASNAGKIDKVVWYNDAKNRKNLAKKIKEGLIELSGNAAGNYINVRHVTRELKDNIGQELVTKYFHAYSLKWIIADGTMIPACTELGKVGEVGVFKGAHLHFELAKDNKKSNPCPTLTGDNKCQNAKQICGEIKQKEEL